MGLRALLCGSSLPSIERAILQYMCTTLPISLHHGAVHQCITTVQLHCGCSHLSIEREQEKLGWNYDARTLTVCSMGSKMWLMVWLIEGGNTNKQTNANRHGLIDWKRPTSDTGSYFVLLCSFRCGGEYIDQSTEFVDVDVLRSTCEFTTVVKVGCCEGKGRYLCESTLSQHCPPPQDTRLTLTL